MTSVILFGAHVEVRLKFVMPMNSGLKVFMDAHDTVTVEEGDRYPLRPPVLCLVNSAVE